MIPYTEKMEQILLAYGLTKEAVTAIMVLYKNMKALVCSSNGVTNFFDIIVRVLQGNTLVPYLFIICLDYVLQTSIDLIEENCFKSKIEKANDILQKLWQTAD